MIEIKISWVQNKGGVFEVSNGNVYKKNIKKPRRGFLSTTFRIVQKKSERESIWDGSTLCMMLKAREYFGSTIMLSGDRE